MWFLSGDAPWTIKLAGAYIIYIYIYFETKPLAVATYNPLISFDKEGITKFWPSN